MSGKIPLWNNKKKKKKEEEEEEEKIQTQNVGDNLNAKHKNQGMRFYKDTFHSADMEE